MAHPVLPLVKITYPLTIDTLGKELACGNELTAHCDNRECYHRSRLNLVTLIRKLGRDFPSGSKAVKPRLFCAKCRTAGRLDRNITVTVSPCSHPHCVIDSRK